MYHLTLKSKNAKTGPIPVSTSTAKTCPESCPFNHMNEGGCYASSGPLALHWRAITEGKRGEAYDGFLSLIRKLPEGQLWRHNQAGDLPGDGDTVDAAALRQLVAANEGKRGFTYTHKPFEGANAEAIREANEGGFVVNLSGNNPAHADELAESGLPTVTVLPMDAPKVSYTPAGRKVVTCPAVTSDKVSCATCGLCAKGDRDYIIGFPAHGTSKKRADAVARG